MRVTAGRDAGLRVTADAVSALGAAQHLAKFRIGQLDAAGRVHLVVDHFILLVYSAHCMRKVDLELPPVRAEMGIMKWVLRAIL